MTKGLQVCGLRALEANEFFQGILETTGVAHTVRRFRDLAPVYANPAAISFLGFDSLEHWMSIDPTTFFPPDNRDLFFNEVRPALQKNGQWSGEITIGNAKGFFVTAHSHVGMMGSCDEEDACFVSSFQDITARKLAEKRMEASERHYEQLFNEMLSGYALFRLRPPLGVAGGGCGIPEEVGDLECLEINPAFEWITGLDSNRIVGKTLSQALVGVRGNLAEFAWAVGCSGQSDRCERYFPEFDRYLEVGAFSPEPGRVVVTCNDITSLVSAKDRYRVANEELETMFANSLVGILLLDGERRVVRSNRRVEEILGYESGQLLGQSMRVLHLDEDRYEQFGERHYPQLAEQQTVQIEYQMRHRDESAVWCCLYGRALSPVGPSQGVLWVLDDISQLKNAERESVQAKNQFLANMSHEIRTPLNGVLGMLQLLLETALGKEQRELAATALGSGKSLLAVLNDILDFSKVEAGKIELRPKPFDLSEALETVFATFRADASARGIELVLDKEEAVNDIPHFLVGDEGRLRQILLNLVGNAVKFTSEGTVTLRVTPLGMQDDDLLVSFEVRDTGMGIPRDKLGAIFDSFIQLDGSFTRRHDGLGLGLGIVRQLTELMGGTLDVDSEVGVGTVFEFRVPLGCVGVDDFAGSSLDSCGEESCEQGLRVLVAEDDPVNRTLAAKLLERLGHKPRTVSTGVEVLGELGRRKFDVILMDVQMPEMDGLETVQRIRAGQSGINEKDISVFAITAHAMLGDRERFLQAGMNDYIAKPVDMGVLAEKLCGIGARQEQD